MLRAKILGTLLVLICAMAVGGCYRSPDVAIHEPGQYKGKTDPLLKQSVAKRAETLRKRFQLAETDR